MTCALYGTSWARCQTALLKYSLTFGRKTKGNQIMEDNNIENNNGTDGKTFSQEDVNRIVGERLAKEKAKTSQELAEREKQLQQKEMEFKAKSVLAEKGYSSELLGAIKCSTEEELKNSLDIIGPLLEQKKDSDALENAKPRFTVPARGRSEHGDMHLDPIRKAMNLI